MLSNAESLVTTSKERIPSLDGWRAIAIIAVIVAHGTERMLRAGSAVASPVLYRATRHGALGVDIFFVLSGFLISTWLLRERQATGRIAFGNFYIRRSFRILPPYLAYLGVLWLLTRWTTLELAQRELASCLLFFRNYIATPTDLSHGWYTAHFWSLAIEEHFYLGWPFLLMLVPYRRVGFLALVCALLVATWRFHEFRHPWLGSHLGDVSFYGRTDIRLDGLLWGCWLAAVMETDAERIARLTRPALLLPLGAALVACAVYQPPLAMVWQPVLICGLIATTTLHARSLATRFLETAPMSAIGILSYSLYLWQQLFLVGSEAAGPLPLGIWQQWPFNLVALCACAIVSRDFIERPMIAVGRRLGQRCTAHASQPPARGEPLATAIGAEV